MQSKVKLTGVLLLTFILGLVSLTLAQADPQFKAWLAQLNGSKWVGENDDFAKYWLQLEGDTITLWAYFRPQHGGNTAQQFSVRLQTRRFTATWRNGFVGIYEISNDGLVITQEDSGGRVLKYIKEN
jgi:hypothetical protein